MPTDISVIEVNIPKIRKEVTNEESRKLLENFSIPKTTISEAFHRTRQAAKNKKIFKAISINIS